MIWIFHIDLQTKIYYIQVYYMHTFFKYSKNKLKKLTQFTRDCTIKITGLPADRIIATACSWLAYRTSVPFTCNILSPVWLNKKKKI